MIYVVLILLLVLGVAFYGYGKAVVIGVLVVAGFFVVSAVVYAIISSVGDDQRKAQEARQQAEKAKAELEVTRTQLATARANLAQTLRHGKEEDELRKIVGFDEEP